MLKTEASIDNFNLHLDQLNTMCDQFLDKMEDHKNKRVMQKSSKL